MMSDLERFIVDRNYMTLQNIVLDGTTFLPFSLLFTSNSGYLFKTIYKSKCSSASSFSRIS